MQCPSGWKANPQAMASVSSRREFTGESGLRLAVDVDPDTWLTPRFILSELGPFDLDPCAAIANPTWVSLNFLTKNDDGLRSPWRGRVFMNPPFSNTGPWLLRHADHRNGISLVPASVESGIWKACVWRRATAILLLHGRTRFCNPDGSSTTGRPLRPIALIAWSAADAEHLAACKLSGVLLRDWSVR